jgi:uncharacterized protein
MNEIKFRFYEELNDFLSEKRKKVIFNYKTEGNPSVKDTIESFGVPHSEIDLILVNSESVNFDYILQDGDFVSVYPVFESFDITNVTHLREKPLRIPKFVADVQLGKLGKYLRILGFDTYYSNKFTEKEVIRISNDETRTILTRNVNLLKNSSVVRGYWIRSQDPRQQVVQVIHYSDLLKEIRLFRRCSECNGILMLVPKIEIEDKLLPNTKKFFFEFYRCNECGKIFWKGSHFKRILNFTDSVRKEVESLFT